MEGCACVRLYYLGEGEMFFESLLFSLFICPSENKKKVSFFFYSEWWIKKNPPFNFYHQAGKGCYTA